MKVRLDSDLRRSNQGTALIGGSPIRLLRLAAAGASMVDRWAEGRPVGASPGATKLAAQLLDAGMIHPVVATADAQGVPIGVVVPVFDDAVGLEATLRSVRVALPDVVIVVVDDASADPAAIERVASAHGSRLVVHATNQGPAATRNTGWRALASDLPPDAVVAFIDADVTVDANALDLLRAHFQRTDVGVVAPRVNAMSGDGLLDAYEAARSPLDLGSEPARVRAGSRVSYVPAAALVARLDVLEQLGGFTESMRSGEDVDFVWRADTAGWQVRYEPLATVRHRNRQTLGDLAKQRFTYGQAAADLDMRHAGDVAPVAASGPMLGVWATWIFGPAVAKVVAVGAAAVLATRLRSLLTRYTDRPTESAARLTGTAHINVARWLATASTRAWLPAALVAVPWSRSGRRWLAASIVLPAAHEWVTKRPAMNPLRFVATRAVDDAAYGAGVWHGAVNHGSFKALLPRLLPSGFGSKPDNGGQSRP